MADGIEAGGGGGRGGLTLILPWVEVEPIVPEARGRFVPALTVAEEVLVI